MKKELSPGVIIAAIVGLLAVVGIVIFLTVKSDPAMQAPNPPPRFDPAAMAADRQMTPPDRVLRNGGPLPNSGQNPGPKAPPPGPAPK